MKILFLSSWFPYPANNGSKLRIFNLLRGLAQHHQLTLLTFADSPDANPNTPELQQLCREIQVVPRKPFTPDSWRARLGFLSSAPRSVVDTHSPEMQQRLERVLSTQNFDLVIASQLAMAGYSQHFQGLPALFEEVELGVQFEGFAQAHSARRRLRNGLTWAKHRHYLSRLLRCFKACTVVSGQEQQLLAQTVPGFTAVKVIPNCINLADYAGVRPAAQPDSLIFTGSFRYFANHDAMTWFLREIYPLVQQQIPAVRLTITGDHNQQPLPPASNITLTGFVDDIKPLIASSWVSLVPIRVGGGTRLKILEAMALGTPVIATSKGAEGLDAQPGEHLLIADQPEDFAAAVVQLLTRPRLRAQLAANAYQLIQEKYNWPATMPRFLNLVEQVART